MGAFHARTADPETDFAALERTYRPQWSQRRGPPEGAWHVPEAKNAAQAEFNRLDAIDPNLRIIYLNYDDRCNGDGTFDQYNTSYLLGDLIEVTEALRGEHRGLLDCDAPERSLCSEYRRVRWMIRRVAEMPQGGPVLPARPRARPLRSARGARALGVGL